MIEKLECTCIEAYKTRKMRDPNCCACSCDHNNLVEQLAKANERVRELEAHNSLLMDVSWQMKEGKPDAFYKIKDARNTQPSDALNKFAIEKQIQELNWCLSRCNHSFDSWADVGMYDSGISNSEIEARIKQLRKEQDQ